LTAFRQFRSVPVENEPVVPIARRRESEQHLQQAVDRGRGEQVAPTHDVGHPLQGVVDHHREMIARRQIAAAEDNIAPNFRRRRTRRGSRTLAIFGPAETRQRGVEGAPHIEAERRPVAAGEAVARFSRGEGAADSRVERGAVRVSPSVCGARDLRAAAKTRVDQAALIEAGERRRIVVAVLALPARRRRKAKPEPSEVVEDGGLELRFAARAVQVFDA